MKRFKLRELLVFKFLAIDFLIVSIIGLLLLFFLDNYQAAAISLALLTISALIIFFISWRMASKIHNSLENLNEAVSALREGKFDIGYQRSTDEIGQISENLSLAAVNIQQKMKKADWLARGFMDVLDTVSTGVIIIDNTGEIIFANQETLKIFDLNEIQGKVAIEAFQNHDIVSLIDKAMIGKEATGKVDLVSPKPRNLDVKASPLVSGPEVLKGCFVTIEDVTAMDRLADVKKDLIDNVSHELRTPIASIRALTDALEASKLENKELNQKFFKDIQKEAEHLSMLVNDVLDLSKIEKQERISKRKISLKNLLTEISSYHNEKNKHKKISLKTDFSDIKLQIKGDKDLLYQAFSNLLENAYKFTPSEGSINLRAKADNGNIVISLKDNGEGIKQKDLERIFERFYTGSRSRSSVKGTGLGLSIAKHAIEKHNGRINVKTTWGKGTEFIVQLPVVN